LDLHFGLTFGHFSWESPHFGISIFEKSSLYDLQITFLQQISHLRRRNMQKIFCRNECQFPEMSFSIWEMVFTIFSELSFCQIGEKSLDSALREHFLSQIPFFSDLGVVSNKKL